MDVWEAMNPGMDEETEQWQWALGRMCLLVTGEWQRA